MDEPAASKTAPARRSPAQKAAQKAGLPPGVALHQEAMGGFSESGRKLKRLEPGDLSEKAKRGRRKPLIPAPDQKILELPDDDIVVIPSIAPGGPLTLTELEDDDLVLDEPALAPPTGAGPEEAARSTVAQALYHEIGKPNSMVTHPGGAQFLLRPGVGEGVVHTRHRVRVPLPGGQSTSHVADLAIELEGGALMVLDVLSASSPLQQVKSHAFDALQLRGVSNCYAVLVFLDGPGGLDREHVESVAHGYDHFFGVSSEHSKDAARFTALRARVVQWIKAAGRR